MAGTNAGGVSQNKVGNKKMATENTIFAPFTLEQVEWLNAYQKNAHVHPFTCGGDRKDAAHLDGEGVLVATEAGWICLYCAYKQSWAHLYMADLGRLL